MIFSFIINLLNFPLKVWWVLLGVLIIILLFYVISKTSNTDAPINTPPEFLSYTKDFIRGFNWEWYWKKDYEGRYEVVGLHVNCPQCATPFAYGSRKCPRCRYYEECAEPDHSEIEIVIYDNVKRKIQSSS